VSEGRVAHYVNGKSMEHGNWMRYINCARNEEEQNMIALQHQGGIYYRVYKDVAPGKELLVWYGEEYAVLLGIALEAKDEEEHTHGVTNVDGKEFVI
jgi:hypothetical protein